MVITMYPTLKYTWNNVSKNLMNKKESGFVRMTLYIYTYLPVFSHPSARMILIELRFGYPKPNPNPNPNPNTGRCI
jgi:hypothetical protein